MNWPRKNYSLIGKNACRARSLRVIPWHLPYNWGKTRKTLVSVAEECQLARWKQNRSRRDGLDMKRMCGTGKILTGFWWKNMKEKGWLPGRPKIMLDNNTEVDQIKQDGRAWNCSHCLRIGACEKLLWTRNWTFGFGKIWGLYWLSEGLLTSQKEAFFVKLVIEIFTELLIVAM
jgi:hypothetical protein